VTGHVEHAPPPPKRPRRRRPGRQELALLDLAQDAIIVRDAEDRVVFWNAAAEQAYGWTRAEAIGREAQELVRARYPGNAEEVREALHRDGRWEGEVVHVARDGRELLMSSRWAARRDADGQIVEVLEANRDVTAQRRAEARLRDSERLLRQAQQIAGVGSWEWDVAADRLTWSETLCALYGIAPDAAPRTFDEYLARVHPDDRATARAVTERAYAERRPFSFDHRLVRPDGAVRHMHGRGDVVLGPDGRVVRMVGSGQDTTERAHAERALRVLAAASELTASLDYRATLATITELAVPALAQWCTVFLLDRAGAMRPAATSCARAGKTAAVERIAARLAEVGAGAGSAARRALETGLSQVVPRFTPALRDALSEDAEFRALMAALAPTSMIVAPLAAHGRVLGALVLVTDDPAVAYGPDDVKLAEDLARRAGVAVDNVRLHEAEQRARAAAEASVERTLQLQRVTAAMSGAVTSEQIARAALDAGLGALDAEAGYMVLLDAAGEQFETIHAVGIAEESLARWRGAPLGARNPMTEAVRARALVAYSTAAEREARWGAPPPAGFAASVIVPLAVDDRAFGAWSLGFREPRDFSEGERAFVLAIGQQAALALERARLYDAERAARAEAERANRSKSEFLAVMSHELRTPLNAIAGYAELLEMGIHGPVTDKQREDLARIRRSQRHLLGLINQILSYARLETGTVRYELDDVSVADALAAVEALILPQVRARWLELLLPTCPAGSVVHADAEKFQQILLNLLSNAVKFTPRGGTVEVGCELQRDWVVVWVRDTGIGIPADQLEPIFQPFVQVHGGLTRPTEGTGLGLAISRDLARGMGGELTAESTFGSGSTFTLRLPRGRAYPRGVAAGPGQ
jgi:PAS domain S-box-containing protein